MSALIAYVHVYSNLAIPLNTYDYQDVNEIVRILRELTIATALMFLHNQEVRCGFKMPKPDCNHKKSKKQ